MQKIYFFITVLFVITNANAETITFPDSFLKEKLIEANTTNSIALDSNLNSIKIDTNNDGEIQLSEALLVFHLNLSSSLISDCSGIESFLNLRSLNCDYNDINELNLNGLNNLQTLFLEHNSFTNLDLSGLYNLQEIHCSYNQLSSLNVSGLTNLQYIDCSDNQLTSLEVNELTNLKFLYCSVNSIPNLIVSGLTNLQELDCSFNQLSSLNISGLTNLQLLLCTDNLLTNVNVSGLVNLEYFYCQNNQLPALNASGLSNLIQLTCSNNQLLSLDVNGSTSLQLLDCSWNQLSSLTISGLTNLHALYCSTNQLTSLNVTGLTNLLELYCSVNLLSSLDVSSLTNLQRLSCGYNQLPSLNVSGLSQLLQLECSANQLTVLNVNGLNNLQSIYCFENLLTSLDVSDLSNLKVLHCATNHLTSLFLKNNNTQWLNLAINENPNLVFICADEEDIALIEQKIATYGYNCHVNSYCSFTPGGTFYTIQGTNRIDTDANGCDTSDEVFSNLKINITNGTASGSTITNNSGNYTIPVQAGTFTLTPQLENPSYFTVSPTSVSVSFPTTDSPFIQNFCVAPNGVHHDLEVIIIPVDAARPGFDATYIIKFKNKGNQTENATLHFNYNETILDFVASSITPTNQNDGGLIWNIGNVNPLQSGEIEVTLNLNSPMETPSVNAGDLLQYVATIDGLALDEVEEDNYFIYTQLVVNSFDPNDKECLEGATINPSMIGNYVHYKIRFENTGSYPAQNIVIKDVIDTTQFDISTLQMTDSSHSCVSRIANPNKVEFIFENINLPFEDATNDGYVVFKIKTKPTLVEGNTISNKANIYFDYNFPIVTNTATSTFTLLGINEVENKSVVIFPNPTSNSITINCSDAIKNVCLFDLQGRLLLNSTTSILDLSNQNTGVYLVKIITANGVKIEKVIKK